MGLAVGSILLAWWLISVAAGGAWFEATHPERLHAGQNLLSVSCQLMEHDR
jgi:hypothetical protein